VGPLELPLELPIELPLELPPEQEAHWAHWEATR
jgi:hypothetical protein